MQTRSLMLGLVLAVAGCASNPAPRAWLPGASDALHDALRTSRRRLPGVLVRLPFAARA